MIEWRVMRTVKWKWWDGRWSLENEYSRKEADQDAANEMNQKSRIHKQVDVSKWAISDVWSVADQTSLIAHLDTSTCHWVLGVSAVRRFLLAQRCFSSNEAPVSCRC